MKNLILLASVAFLFVASSCRSTKTIYPDYSFNADPSGQNQTAATGQTQASTQYEDDVYAKAGTPTTAGQTYNQNSGQNQYAQNQYSQSQQQQNYVPAVAYDQNYAYDQYGNQLGYSPMYCQNHPGAVGYPTSSPYNAGGMSGSAILNQAMYQSPINTAPAVQYTYDQYGNPTGYYQPTSQTTQSTGNPAVQVSGEVYYGPRGNSGGRLSNPTTGTTTTQNQSMSMNQVRQSLPSKQMNSEYTVRPTHGTTTSPVVKNPVVQKGFMQSNNVAPVKTFLPPPSVRPTFSKGKR